MKTLPPHNSQAWTNTANALALFFTQELAKEIGAAKFKRVAALNATETNPGVCHSHDFCDANEVMAAAFIAAGFAHPADDMADTNVCDMWEAAWKIARGMIGSTPVKTGYLVTKSDGSTALLFDKARAHGIAGHHGWTVKALTESETREHVKNTLKLAGIK